MSESATAPAAAETAPSDGAAQSTEPNGGTQSLDTTPPVQPTAFGADVPATEPVAQAVDAPAEPWFNELPNDLRSAPVFQKYKTQEDALRGLVDAQKLIGQKQIMNGLVRPAEGSPEPEFVAYETQLYKDHIGVPDSVDGYNVDAEKYNVDGVKPLAEIAHKAKLGNKQFNALVEAIAERETQQKEEATKAAQEHAAKNLHALQQEWGAGYEHNMLMANSGLDALGDIEGLREIVTSPTLQSSPEHNAIIKAFARVGEMFKEGGLKTGTQEIVQLSADDYLKQNYDKINSPYMDSGASRREYQRLLDAEKRS